MTRDNSRTNAYWCWSTCRHFFISAFTFSGERASFMVTDFTISPRNCISCVGMREFTKVLKPILALTWQRGFRIIAYLDDMMLMAQSPQELKSQLWILLQILQLLGFRMNWKKSTLIEHCWTLNGRQRNSYVWLCHLNLSRFHWAAVIGMDRCASLRSTITIQSPFCSKSLISCSPSILKCWRFMNLFRTFRFITGMWVPSFCCGDGSTGAMAPFWISFPEYNYMI